MNYMALAGSWLWNRTEARCASRRIEHPMSISADRILGIYTNCEWGSQALFCRPGKEPRRFSMKTNIVAIGLAILLAAAFGLAQSQPQQVSAKIPFEFTAAGKVFPAGQYNFSYNSVQRYVIVRGVDKESEARVILVTMLARGMHTTPSDAHVVFDKIGNNRFLSELWIPGLDGLDLLSTKEKHEHEIVNVPVLP